VSTPMDRFRCEERAEAWRCKVCEVCEALLTELDRALKLGDGTMDLVRNYGLDRGVAGRIARRFRRDGYASYGTRRVPGKEGVGEVPVGRPKCTCGLSVTATHTRDNCDLTIRRREIAGSGGSGWSL